MISAMLNIDATKQSILVVVIEPENLERMKEGDPITLMPSLMGGVLPPMKYPDNFALLVAYEENQEELYKAASGTMAELMTYLERGFKFLPIDGAEKARHVLKMGKSERDS